MPVARVRDAHSFCKDMKKAEMVYAVQVDQVGKLKVALLPPEFSDFKDVLAAGSVVDKQLPEGVEYTINLEPGQRPPFWPLYNLSVRELEVLRKYLEQAQKNG